MFSIFSGWSGKKVIGWSFVLAVVSCILETIVGAILLFEGINIKLVKNYLEKMYIQKKRLFPSAPN